jgi:predicted dehydrogenase
LKASAAVAAGSLLQAAPNVHAGGSDELKVGLIGCGGRGTGAAEQACNAGKGIKLVAMGDMFPDKLEQSRNHLRSALGDRYAVKDDCCFLGFDAYKQVIPLVDVVLLTTPPHFRPLHLEAAIAAGKHVFTEKPMAVDAPGVRRVMAACEEARKKSRAVVAGFCWRYHGAVREAMKRVHDGAIGDIVAVQCSYNTGTLWHYDRQPSWSDMEWQLRNWLYFTWLSGDHIVEQAVHNIDKLGWAMKDTPPKRAYGMGGRQVRTDPKFGHIFDHHSVVYEFDHNVRAFHTCRQQPGVHNDVSDHILGTKGVCHISGSNGAASIEGEKPWVAEGKLVRGENMYQNEHNELFASIRADKPINNGDSMCKSTLMAIMGRMATYTGQVITWDMALNSQEDLTPPKYEMGPLAVPPVPMPGKTKFA